MFITLYIYTNTLSILYLSFEKMQGNKNIHWIFAFKTRSALFGKDDFYPWST